MTPKPVRSRLIGNAFCVFSRSSFPLFLLSSFFLLALVPVFAFTFCRFPRTVSWQPPRVGVGKPHFNKRVVQNCQADLQVVPVIAVELKFTDRIGDGLVNDRILPYQDNPGATRRPFSPAMHHLTREGAWATHLLFELQIN